MSTNFDVDIRKMLKLGQEDETKYVNKRSKLDITVVSDYLCLHHSYRVKAQKTTESRI